MFGRKAFFIIPLLALLLVFSAIPALSQDDATTVTWLMLGWGGAEEVVAQFEEENPDINVELEQVPFNALFEQISVRLGADSSDPGRFVG